MASSSADPAPQPFAELLTWLEQRAEYAYDPRELADIVWLAMERERLDPSGVETARPISSDETSDDDVITIIDDGPAPELPLPSTIPEPAPAPSGASVVPQSTPELERQFGAPVPISLSAPSPLPNALELSRALYPLMRRVPSPSRDYLDEEATVTQIADQRIKLPVMRPEPERWLELALVIEDTSILDIWQDTLAAFQKLLERHGAFRDVRTWYLQDEAANQLCLVRKRQDRRASQNNPADAQRTRPRSPQQIADVTGRRLILFVSDCTSVRWRDGRLPQQLVRWSETSPVTLVQLLPAYHRDRSALGQGYPVWFSAQTPGTLSPNLKREGLRPRQLQRLRGEDNERIPFNLPVITLDAKPMRDWAKVLTGSSEAETAGVVLAIIPPTQIRGVGTNGGSSSGLASKTNLASETNAATPSPESRSTAPLSSQQRVTRFWATASPPARRLAGMMAAQPVSLPVARLIQKELLRDERPALLAEIFLSGLIRAQHPETTATAATSIWSYDFLPEVRSLLLKATALSTTEDARALVMEGVKAKLPPEAREQIERQAAREYQRISQAIEAGIGLSSRQFEAFVVPTLLKQWWEKQDGGDAQLGEVITSLAELSVPALRAMGGKWAMLAEQLPEVGTVETSQPVPGPNPEPIQTEPPIKFEPLEVETAQLVEIDDTVSWPPLQTETVTIATVTFPDDGNTGLERFDFTTATITRTQRQDFFGRLTPKRFQQQRWKITKQTGSAYRWVERLPEDTILEMVQIPAGRFLMGSPESEPQRGSNEDPQHEVELQAFWMGRYPVTQAQWRVVAQLEPVEQNLDSAPARFKGDNRPIENVSWEDAVEFCRRLSQYTGRDYRLPTEAEWEYACRAGTTTPFHFGPTLSTKLANYDGSEVYADGPKGKESSETTSVDEFPANAWGLSDMHGNVWEWCQDQYHDSYEGAPSNGTAWIDQEPNNELYIIRGGSWIDLPWFCRSARRDGYGPSSRHSYIGIRVVCAAPRT